MNPVFWFHYWLGRRVLESVYQPLDKTRNVWHGNWDSVISFTALESQSKEVFFYEPNVLTGLNHHSYLWVGRSWVQSFGKYHECWRKWMAEADIGSGPNSRIDPSNTKTWFRHGGSWLVDWDVQIIWEEWVVIASWTWDLWKKIHAPFQVHHRPPVFIFVSEVLVAKP